MGALSEHDGFPARLAEYRRQFERASRSPGDNPSVFAIELETLRRCKCISAFAAGAG